MRMNVKIKKAWAFLLVSFLLMGLTGCQKEIPDKNNTKTEESQNTADDKEETKKDKKDDTISNKTDVTNTEENESAAEEMSALRLKEEELADTYWRAAYYKYFGTGESEEYITECDEDYYRFMDVYFANDNTAEFRSIVGDSYESVSGQAVWRIAENGDAVLDNIVPFEGMNYGYGFVPRFSLADPLSAPMHEEGLISLEYMEGCMYFRQMEKSDPYEGVDLANSDKLRNVLELAEYDGQDITGEWVLWRGETDGDLWYALESGVECTLFVGQNFADYHYSDSYGNSEVYYGMKMIYEETSLYSDFPCDYTISFQPDDYEYEDRYQYLNFSMAPDGEYLIVVMSMEGLWQDYPVQSILTFQRGFG